MNRDFALVVEALHPRFEALMASSPFVDGNLPRDMPSKGVYLFSESDQHLYVGRSNSLRKRYKQHCNPGSQHNQAVFAFKLARHATGRLIPGYVRGEGSRIGLLGDPAFLAAFVQSKDRVRRMSYRFIEETDQTRQALLELYCAIALRCPYNDFNTH
jgi:hypothetical protein